jgi:hypothetical protein
MSLLDDVSIVVTPNGYKAGELYAVIPVPSEGAEEVTNGDFTTDTDWSKEAGWEISGGTANSSGVGYSRIWQDGVLTSGKIYKLRFDITAYTSGQLEVYNNGQWEGAYDAVNSYEKFINANTSFLYFRAKNSSPFIGSIDNVSVKEYTSADMDVTRATAATRVDENGLIEDVLANVPRIDYTGGGCPHILAEPQRTNQLLNSNDISQIGTIILGDGVISKTGNYAESPDGTQNATRVVASATGGGYGLISASAVSSTSGDYVGSVYLKSNNGANQNIALYGRNSVVTYVTITTNWNRYNVLGSVSSNFFNLGCFPTNGSDTSVDFLAWGGQIEHGSYPTSYIPTSGSTVTRNQDIFTRDGIGSLINSTEGVLFVEMAALSDDLTYRRISLSDSTEDNRISISYDDVSNTISGQVFVGGVEQSLLTYVLSDITEFSKIALKYKVNDFELWVDGYEIATGVSGSVFPQGTLNSLSFDNGSSVQNFFGKVKQLQVYDTTLTVSQLENLTV